MKSDVLKGKQVQIPLFRQEGQIRDYLKFLSKHDLHLAQRLKAMGLPSKGHFRITTTPGDYYGSAYKDFTVESFATLLGNLDVLDPDSLGGMHHLSGPDVWRVWRIWLMDIKCDDLDSCIRYVWNDATHGGFVTIENINTALQRAKNNRIEHPAHNVIAQLKRLLPGLRIIEIEQERRGRPKGSGYFANQSDFLSALKDVLSKIKNPTEPKVLYDLSCHNLWQRKPFTLDECQKRTKTLRNWLTNCSLTWEMALEMFCSDTQRGHNGKKK